MAPPSGRARPSSAAAVASAHRAAATGSPESRASHARARHSRGSLMTSSRGERVEPAHDRGRAAILQRARSTSVGDQVRGIGLAPGRQQVADGTGHVAGLCAPCPRSRVQLGDVLGRAAVLELAAQDVAEDVVVAKPLAALVERDEEEVGALDLGSSALEPPSPRTASHSGALRRSSTQVPSRKLRACGLLAETTSSPR